jgi:hypothetical protein
MSCRRIAQASVLLRPPDCGARFVGEDLARDSEDELVQPVAQDSSKAKETAAIDPVARRISE